MEDAPTCGKGLAAQSAVPRLMGTLAAAVANVIETHMEALDLTDEGSKQEHAAYTVLVDGHRKNAAALKATAERMAGYRDLPMGRHDERAMSGPKAMQTFEEFATAEQGLLTLLQSLAEESQEMLAEMRQAGDGAEQADG